MQQVSAALAAALFLGLALATSGARRHHNNNTVPSSPADQSDVPISAAAAARDDRNYGPVIFVPGVGGSQLEARLNKTERVHRVCRLQSDWSNLWLNMHLLAPISFDCLVDNMRLVYDRRTKLTSSPQGVAVRPPPPFGLLEGVEYLDRLVHLPETGYFHSIISALRSRLDYMQPDENVFGAAYDFRKAPNELGEFYANLSQLVEHAYYRSNYRPATLICHSLGCLNALHWLNARPLQWKDVYIRRLIALAAPWKGAYRALSSLLLGDNLGVPILNGHKVRDLQITFPSLMYLFPQRDAFDKPDGRVLVETMSKNYTFDNLAELFEDAGMADQLDMWLNIRDYAARLRAPNVELWCLYGRGVPTPSGLVYEGDLLRSPARQLMADGDGTVNLESSLACEQFRRDQPDAGKPVHLEALEGTSHVGVLRSRQVADYIVERIFKAPGAHDRSAIAGKKRPAGAGQ